jgi:hypothetical protein
VPQPELLSPEWWLARLYKQLVERQKIIEILEDYYCGDHPLPWLPEQARQEFRRVLKMTRTNVMGLVCDSTAERMQIVGFRLGSIAEDDSRKAAEKNLWRIWQANGLDSGSDQSILDAVITGQGYALAAPNPDDPKTPYGWFEHPSQAIVECVPGNRRERAAGLKVWLDDWTGMVNATLFLRRQAPDEQAFVFKYQAKKPPGGSQPTSRQWQRREVPGEDWPAVNPLNVVPLIELPNRPRTLIGGISELADVMDIQDRINKTVADRLITQDFGAFPQKWATAWPEKDQEGNPTPKIDVGRNRMVTSDIQETKFGQWDAAPLDPYSLAKKEDVRDVASRTRTPAQYLLGDMSNVNGETLKASESGLVSKVRQSMRFLDDPIEDFARLLLQAAGEDVPAESMETIWRNPEYRTEGELVDALTKMSTLHVPDEVLWEKWGASPQEIDRWKALNLEQQTSDPIIAAARSLTAPPTGPASAAPSNG